MQAELRNPVPQAVRNDFLPDLCQPGAVFGLVLVTELLVLTLELATSGIGAFIWFDFALRSLFVLWIVLLSAAVLCVLRTKLLVLPLPAGVGGIFAVILGITAALSLVGDWVMAGAGFEVDSLAFDADALLRNLIVSAVMSGLVLRYFYLQAQLRRQQQAELQARIEALQARINPHFLFNSMNSIASLIGTDPAAAERAVEDLCDLFRASLKTSAGSVRLTEEIHLCQRYLAIEQLRLGPRLKVRWQVEAFPAHTQIPLLTLQPLLENAVYHGIQPAPQGGEIQIHIEYAAGQLILTVTNPCCPQAGTGDLAGHRMALENIRARLSALYGGRAKLETQAANDAFVTQLYVPVAQGGD